MTSKTFDAAHFPVAVPSDPDWGRLSADAHNRTGLEAFAPRALPNALAVRNNSSQPVVMVSVVFSVGEGSGQQYMVDSFQSKRNLIEPGESMLFTPYGGTNYGLNQPVDLTKELARLAHCRNMTASLEAVYLADGRVVGPDGAKSLDFIHARVVAWNDLLAEVHTQTLMGVTDEQLTVWLQSQRAARITAGDYYATQRNSAIRHLSLLAQQGKLSTAAPMTQRFAKGAL